MSLVSRMTATTNKVLGLLLLAGGVLGLTTMAQAGQESVAASKVCLGELYSPGAVNYKVGLSPWLSQSSGTFPVTLPLQIKTGDAPCRVLLPGRGLFEASKNSVFTLSEAENSQLALAIDKGSVLYSLPEGSLLKIVQPLKAATALAGTPIPAGASAKAEAPGLVNIGVAQVQPGQAAEFSNVSGNLAVSEGASPALPVSTMQTVQVTPTASAPVVRTVAASPTASEAVNSDSKAATVISDWKIIQAGDQVVTESRQMPSERATIRHPHARVSAWKPK